MSVEVLESSSNGVHGILSRYRAAWGIRELTADQLFQEVSGVRPHELPYLLDSEADLREIVGAKRIRDRIAALFECSRAEASALLGVSESRFSRNDCVSREMLDRSYALAVTFMLVADALRGGDAAVWFNTAHRSLEYRPPLQYLRTSYGHELVRAIAKALEIGAYV
jgi:uncharacterized protein (DUF2384 family)